MGSTVTVPYLAEPRQTAVVVRMQKAKLQENNMSLAFRTGIGTVDGWDFGWRHLSVGLDDTCHLESQSHLAEEGRTLARDLVESCWRMADESACLGKT